MLIVIEEIFRVILAVVEIVLAIPLAYLALLSVAALVSGATAGRRSSAAVATPATGGRLPRFALLIPAHDEASVIRNLLSSIAELDYPADLFEAIVVADNCTDATATLARDAGARVYERTDLSARAKGYALAWLLEQLKNQGRIYDAYVIIDADSSVEPSFLRHMAAALASGKQVIQARYLVRNAHESRTAGLRAVAFVLFNHVRPMGRRLFGWSAGLKGNGMCFKREVIEQLGWGAASLAEDVEFHARLLEAGIIVAYEPAAIVTAEMPTNLRQARSQQARWEGGRLALIKSCALPLLRSGIRNRRMAEVDAAAEILLPPLSLVAVLVTLCLVAAALSWYPPIAILALCLVAALVVHLLAGVALARLSMRAYLSLLMAPLYIPWKCGVYLAAMFGRGANSWERTARGR